MRGQYLEVAPNASDEEIKKAFRKATKKFHPDYAEDDESKGKRHNIQSAINAAYEVLSDTDKKRRYDEKVAQEQANQKAEQDRRAQQERYDAAQQRAREAAEREAEERAKQEEEKRKERERQAAEEKEQARRRALSALHKYDVVFILVYSFFFVSFMPCIDPIIGQQMKELGGNRTLSEIIGVSGKAAIISFWFIYWIFFMILSMVIAKRDRERTGKIEVGKKPKIYAALIALSGLGVFLTPQLALTICNLYNELRSFFAISPLDTVHTS